MYSSLDEEEICLLVGSERLEASLNEKCRPKTMIKGHGYKSKTPKRTEPETGNTDSSDSD